MLCNIIKIYYNSKRNKSRTVGIDCLRGGRDDYMDRHNGICGLWSAVRPVGLPWFFAAGAEGDGHGLLLPGGESGCIDPPAPLAAGYGTVILQADHCGWRNDGAAAAAVAVIFRVLPLRVKVKPEISLVKL